MRESSKLGYTCTCNEYKWAMRHKHVIIKCSSLLVQVYTQVLMKIHLNKYSPHEAQYQKHAKNIYIKAYKLK